MTRLAPALLLLPLSLTACPQEETRQPPPGGTTTVPTGTTTTNTTANGGGGAGGDGGTAGTGQGGTGGQSTGGAGGGTDCGNDIVEPGEDCEASSLGDVTCETLGFTGGTLACSPTCTLDISDCTGAEKCSDGVDNDGDGAVDCDEPDCKPSCDDPCALPVFLTDPGDAAGSTALHADLFTPTCTPETGGEIVYRVDVTQSSGVLDIVLVEDGAGTFSLSARATCAPAAPELACAAAYSSAADKTKKLTLPVTLGDTVFVVVDATSPDVAGSYSLAVQSRPVECGDGLQDAPEECDDGNALSGDGCDAACLTESDELEPNGTVATANPFVAPWISQIDPAGDIDLVAIPVPAAASLSVTVAGLGPDACFDGTLDSLVTILDPAGTPLVTNDDAAGLGSCSRAVAPNLAPGTYFARVSATGLVSAEAATFPYVLTVETFDCGDGVASPGEECDDGNATANDGCSPTCTLDVDETEPNGTLATSDVYTSGWVARIDPDADVDLVSITVPAGAKLTAVTSDPTSTGLCFTKLDTFVEILDPNGAVLAENDDAGSYCSTVTVTNLAAGKHHVRIQAPPLLGMSNVYVFPYALTLTVE